MYYTFVLHVIAMVQQANMTTSITGCRNWCLSADAVVIEQGSVDAAAAHLRVTPSAVSQRIKALEQRVGQVLVVREKPCTATAAGVPLLRLAAQTALLEAEALREMGGSEGTRTPDIAQ
jgi:LysR family transcriptional regulator (chromosome initiation inhibitor)